MSSVNISSEYSENKVLPGDKTGLPWEIWQMILSWLSAGDLCRCASVSKNWNDLVISVDSTRWKELYMSCSEWRHPFWPLNTQAEPPSWRLAYRDQYISTKFWCHRQKLEAKTTSCSGMFKKNSFQKNIYVGPGLEHETLKSALGVANSYDRIVVHSGIYDEAFEISPKFPIELVGHGELGSVILVVGIQQVSIAARLSNLVLRAPWFTSFIIMINSGYLQVDNCILEDGMVCAQNPSTVHIKFCTFRHATVILQYMNTSIIENCEFSQSDSANIIIEGHPKDEKNWTYAFLRDRTSAIYHQKRSLHRKKKVLKGTTSMTSSTLHSSFTGKSLLTGFSNHMSDSVSRDASFNLDEPGAMFLNPHIPVTGRFLNPLDRDGMVGCGDLQSMYQESVCPDQTTQLSTDGKSRHQRDNSITLSNVSDLYPGETGNLGSSLVPPKDGNKHSQHTKRPNSRDSLPLPDNPEIHSKRGQTPSSYLSKDVSEKVDISASYKMIRNNFRRKSLGSCSLQQLDEEERTSQWVSSLQHNPEVNPVTEGHEGSEAMPSSLVSYIDVVENGEDSKKKQSAMKKEGRRKSVDSHVDFQLEPAKEIPDDLTASLHHRINIVHEQHNVQKTTSVQKNGESQSATNGARPKTPKKQVATPVKKLTSSDGRATHKDTVQSLGLDDQFELCATPYMPQSDVNEAPGSRRNSEPSHNGKGACNGTQNGDVSLDGNHRVNNHDKNRRGSVKSDVRKHSDSHEHHKHHARNRRDSASNRSQMGSQGSVRSQTQRVDVNIGTDSKDSKELIGRSIDVYLAGPSQDCSSTGSSPYASRHLDHTGNPSSEHTDIGALRNSGAMPSQEDSGGSRELHVSNAGDSEAAESTGQPGASEQNENHPHHHHHHHYHHYHQPHDHHNPEIPHFRRSQSDELLPQSDDDLSILDELDDSYTSEDSGSDAGNGPADSTTDSSDIESVNNYSGSEDDLSTSEESVIMLPHLREFHLQRLDHSTSPQGVQAEVASINSDCTRPVPVNVSEDSLMSSYVDQIHGCLIHQCRMNHSKGGLMVSLQAHAIISECDISNVGYGIRCIQNARVVILKNKIHHCRTSGIFMRLAASGLIAGNDIHSNNEAGIDVRKNADPLVQFNQIHHGKRSGVVVLGSGRGQIKKNDIYCNMEAGVYVLYGGNPTISENHIYDGRAAGVAVNAGGKGCIVDNVIRGNQWGGIDIRNGSCPLVSGNSIINGNSDGIVVGVAGKGSIENNFISGNAGCGLWMMAAKHLYIHGNQICNSGHCGVMMLDKTATSVDSHIGQLVTTMSHRTYSHYEDDLLIPEPKTDWAVLQYNNIYHNKGQGINIEIEEQVHLYYNAIHGNLKDGVTMSNNAPVILEGNSVTSNNGSGIITSTQNKVKLTGNGVYDNAQHGIVCRNECVVEENDIVGNTLCAVMVEGQGNAQILKNRLCSSNNPAIREGEAASLTAVGNKVFDRGGGDFYCIGKIVAKDNTVIRPTLVVQSNRGPSSKNEFNKTDFLKDPVPRPHIAPPPPSTVIPTHHVTVVTKVTVPSGDSCEQGSKLCIIL